MRVPVLLLSMQATGVEQASEACSWPHSIALYDLASGFARMT